MTTKVALDKCEDYNFDLVYQSIRKLFELVPPPDVKDKVVLIKPNILYPKKPELAVCTHPVVVGATVKAFLDIGAKKVIVGESPAIANSTSAAKATGMYEQIINNGGEWVEFNKAVTVPCNNGKLQIQFDFAEQFTEADLVVSVAKLKTHQLMAFTGAMKNLFGLVLGLEKAQMHYRFPNKKDFAAYLTDLVLCANPGYAIMDAIVGMEGPGGPGSGDPVKLGFLAASDNILALDWECASLVGYNPHTIMNLEDALQRQIWLKNPKEIETVGVAPESVKAANFKIVRNPSPTLSKMLPPFISWIAKAVFVKTPHFNEKKCKKCQRCLQICPPKIISMNGKDGTAMLEDKSKCQHCYCCHEICPFDAIALKRF
ncbi:MAG: DUF362 domain-containing protein [Treponema sp.]|nr:DUF362 domain-containing protein [Treponema sp.]